MGNKKEKQLITLSVLLLLASVLVYWTTNPVKVTKPVGLQAALGPVSGYTALKARPLDDQTFSFLDLDDYTQTRYAQNGQTVDLYIGYYFSLDKVSAAHSPLVCFPGQGWTISEPTMRRLTINQHEIHYAEIIASMEEHRELVIYWYQAHEKTVPEAYKNKLNALANKITGKKQEHAFVRVSVPVGNAGQEEAEKIGRDFITAFYPTFLTYVNSAP
jgi:EpsI family protein